MITAIQTHCILSTYVVGQMFLKIEQLLPVNKVTIFKTTDDGAVDLLLISAIMFPGIDKRDAIGMIYLAPVYLGLHNGHFYSFSCAGSYERMASKAVRHLLMISSTPR